jgi:hypothetical protein
MLTVFLSLTPEPALRGDSTFRVVGNAAAAQHGWSLSDRREQSFPAPPITSGATGAAGMPDAAG